MCDIRKTTLYNSLFHHCKYLTFLRLALTRLNVVPLYVHVYILDIFHSADICFNVYNQISTILTKSKQETQQSIIIACGIYQRACMKKVIVTSASIIRHRRPFLIFRFELETDRSGYFLYASSNLSVYS